MKNIINRRQNPSTIPGESTTPRRQNPKRLWTGAIWIPLRHAAAQLGLSKRTLLRAHQNCILPLGKKKGVWYVRKEVLTSTPLLSIGKAAKHIGIHYETARNWAKVGKLLAVRLPKGRSMWSLWRRVSLAEIGKAKGRKYQRP